MPISLPCPGCSSLLNAPAAKAGKRIQCPKCGEVCAVPGTPAAGTPDYEVVDDSDPTPAPATVVAVKRVLPPETGKDRQPRDDRKNLRAENRDDRPRRKKPAEDDEDGRPRKRKEKAGSAPPGGSTGLVIAVIIGGVLLLVGAGFSIYWFGFRGKVDSTSPELATGENWETYTGPSDTYRVSFPGKPQAATWEPHGNLKPTSDLRVLTIGEKQMGKPGITFFAGFMRFPDNVQAAELEETKNWLITLHAAPYDFGMRRESKVTKKVQASGQVWDEIRMEVHQSGLGIIRWVLVGPKFYFAGYRSNLPLGSKDAVEKFLASYKILGGDTGDPDPAKLDGWEVYKSADGAFEATFPGPSKPYTNFFIEGATKSVPRVAIGALDVK